MKTIAVAIMNMRKTFYDEGNDKNDGDDESSSDSSTSESDLDSDSDSDLGEDEDDEDQIYEASDLITFDRNEDEGDTDDEDGGKMRWKRYPVLQC